MATTPNLGLALPLPTDTYSLAVWNSNSDIVDASPGVKLCANSAAVSSATSGWGSSQEGMLVYEQDTAIYYQWNGSALIRPWPMGRLAETALVGAFNTSNGSGSPATVLSSSVAVPNPTTNRHQRVTAIIYGTACNTAPGSTIPMCEYQLIANGVTEVTYDPYGYSIGGGTYYSPAATLQADVQLSAGTYTFALKLWSYAGTLACQPPTSLLVTEV